MNETPNSAPEAPNDAQSVPKQRKRRGRRTKSDEEFEARIDTAAMALSQLVPKAHVKRALKQQYNCTARMCENYISRGAERAQKWTTEEKPAIFAQTVGVLQGMLRSKMKMSAKLLVLDRFIRLYGLAGAEQLTVKLANAASGALGISIIEIVRPSNAGDGATPDRPAEEAAGPDSADL